MSFSTAVGTVFKKYFIGGLLIVVPLIITYLVLKALFEALDGLLQPLIHKLAGFYIPGLGVITTLVLIIVAGIFTHNLVGRKIYNLWERLLVHVPLIRPIYSASKSLLESTTASKSGSFQEVVLVEYPRAGSYAIGFVANRLLVEIDGSLRQCASVFIPSPPTPFAGPSVILPLEQVQLLDISVEQALKFIVSGGVVAPSAMKRKGLLVWNKPVEVSREAG
ncbi:hypothetical protein C3F09_12425 [candidate division GN15 bacterium]|uniref:DUF502 domain-containing protein n=1 Tax=candidate division GN15 bacterium TaxID=2072418 RepID=A0A855WVB5_9BACT|nr:MAG: hypothetical protein C3F09_12425 [candidate division GN15 bacterium]